MGSFARLVAFDAMIAYVIGPQIIRLCEGGRGMHGAPTWRIQGTSEGVSFAQRCCCTSEQGKPSLGSLATMLGSSALTTGSLCQIQK